MANSIPAGEPSAPQVRKQVMNESGVFVPVPDAPPVEREPAGPAPRPFLVGDVVILTGRVLEVHGTQGGQVSVKVQLPNGAAWLQGGHIEHVTEPEPDPQIATLKAQVAELKAAAKGAAKD